MSDITRDDLCYVKPPSPEDFGSHYSRTRKVTDDEFDRLARRAGYVKVDILNRDGNVVAIHEWARDWVVENPAKALRALLTDECETCEGTGTTTDGESWGPDECPACGGRGWLPKDGIMLQGHWAYGPRELAIPLDWLEAGDE